MSVEKYGDKWRVRWYAQGKHPSKTFSHQIDAQAFDAKMKRRHQINRASKKLSQLNLVDSSQQVYVVLGGDKVKIGQSSDPPARLAAMQTGSPAKLELIWRINCPNAVKLEMAFHRRYRAYHSHGEWYEAEPILSDLQGMADLGAVQFFRPARIPNESYTPVASDGAIT